METKRTGLTLLAPRDMWHRLRCSDEKLRQMVRDGLLPEPFKISLGSKRGQRRWLEHEVDQAIVRLAEVRHAKY